MVQHSTTTAMSSSAAANKTGVVIVSSLQGLTPLPLGLPGTASSSRRPSKRPRRVVNDDGDDVRAPRRRPVILYENTPKVIHARPDEFKALVQRLTGPQLNGTAGGSGDQDQEAVLRYLRPAQTAAALSSQQEQDPLVLTLEQPQHVPPPLPLVDDDHHHTTPVVPLPSPGAAADGGGFLLSPSNFLFSPTTMEAIHELIS